MLHTDNGRCETVANMDISKGQFVIRFLSMLNLYWDADNECTGKIIKHQFPSEKLLGA